LSFTALDYTNPKQNQYAYKLEGLDHDWIQTGNKHEAEYTHVPPGKYTVGNELNIPLRIVPDELARYLVDTGQATMTLEKSGTVTITVTCDRCGREVIGMEGDGGTAGFYRVAEGIWSKYANEGEAILCDACMQSDPRYLADYPPVVPPVPEELVTKWKPLGDFSRLDLDGLTVDELRDLAEANGIDLPGGKVKKADLIELIAHAAVQPHIDDLDLSDEASE
jgi:hypothetical protein